MACFGSVLVAARIEGTDRGDELHLAAKHARRTIVRMEDRAMRLPRMTVRRWMIAVAIVALALVVAMRLFAPIVWDIEGRARDDQWLKVQWGEGGDPP